MKRFLVTALVILVVSSAVVLVLCWRSSASADIFPSEQLTVDGEIRNYRLVIPLAQPKPAAIVFAFQGMGDSPESMAKYSQLDGLAADHGFLLVYPAARETAWDTANLDNNADIRFFDQLLDQLSQKHEIDRNRVYIVGMSNGAGFVQLLAAARPNQIAAVAAHSGTKPPGLPPSENPRPILLIGGENDPAAFGMPSDADQYRADGHIVQLISVPDLGHEWSVRHNSEIWNFLSQHTSNGEP